MITLPDTVTVPCAVGTDAVTVVASPSTSVIRLATLMVTVPSSSVVAVLSATIGASSCAVIEMVNKSMASIAPPDPVLPPSLVVMVNVTSAVALSAGLNVGGVALRNALMSVRFPDSVSAAVPLSPTVTPVPPVADSVPSLTESVTLIAAVPASTSETDRPFRLRSVSSIVV